MKEQRVLFCLLPVCWVEESEDEDDTRTTSGISFLDVRLVSLLVLGREEKEQRMILCLLLACCVEESEDEDDIRYFFFGCSSCFLTRPRTRREGAEDDLVSASRLLC